MQNDPRDTVLAEPCPVQHRTYKSQEPLITRPLLQPVWVAV